MAEKVILKMNAYHDSVTLMSLSSKINQMEGVKEAVVSMATQMNKDLLENIGIITEEVQAATENDLMIAVQAETKEHLEKAIKAVEEELTSNQSTSDTSEKQVFKTLDSGFEAMPEANLAIISVPGRFAAREAKLALEKGMNVMLFSDGVSLDEEKSLKQFGRKKGLLVMGPDCGTSIINHTGLCFANKVSKGGIGLVAASGTGLQEVTVQIDRFGYGITQAIGTGGRDLHEKIGGITMLQGLEALEKDEKTKVIVLISKPPALEVQRKLLERVKECEKPVVICFLDGSRAEVEESGAKFAKTLFDAAKEAVMLLDPKAKLEEGSLEEEINWVKSEREKLTEVQTDIRGLFCGGTLTTEAMILVRSLNMEVKSNVAEKPSEQLEDLSTSNGHTFLDMGEDEFTQGKPHPMIEPSLRNERILKEAKDPKTAVILLDFELGFGGHENPVAETIETINEAKRIASKQDRHLSVIAYICGTAQDKQNFQEQKEQLQAAGVYVTSSNALAAKMASMIVNEEVDVK